MIHMQNISKAYGGSPVLQCVNLHIAPGAYAAFVGRSGSGKSTLLNLLGCLDSPTSGRYVLDGLDVSRLTPKELCCVRRERIGFVFQGYQLFRRFSAAQNVAFPLMLRGMEEARRLELATQALERVGLGGYGNFRPAQLSGGQQQRVALARAMITRPRLLLCDEPTGALDEESRNGILGLLDELHESGHTIVLITHDRYVAQRARECFRVQAGGVTPCASGGLGL